LEKNKGSRKPKKSKNGNNRKNGKRTFKERKQENPAQSEIEKKKNGKSWTIQNRKNFRKNRTRETEISSKRVG